MQQTLVTSRRLLLTLLAALSVSSACSGSGKTPSADVWATVDNKEIRREDVERAYRSVLQPNQPPQSDEELIAAKLSIVDELITQEVLLARGQALNITVTDADVDKAFNERKSNMTEEQFQAQLKERSLTPDDMRQALRRELIAQKVIEREVSAKVVISEQEITDYFNSHRAQFNVSDTQYRIGQIVITPVRDPQLRNRKGDDAITPEDAQRKAAMLMERLKGGAPFSELAMDYSEDQQSLANGGDLGFISATQLKQVPAILRDAVLALQPGNVRVVPDGKGAYNLVLLAAKEEAGQRDLTMPGVKDGISSSLRDRRERVLRAAYLTTQRNQSKIANHLARQLVQTQGKPPSLVPGAPAK